MKKVTIVQRVLPHYRMAFYQRLYETLGDNGISFELIYGQQEAGTVPETVQTDAPWAVYCPNLYFHVLGQEFVWQKIPARCLDTDLLIFEQANRLLNNYFFLYRRRSSRKVAFWGHGGNMQSCGRSARENLKKKFINKVDWWFAYTNLSTQRVKDAGFPADRITTVNNSIDTATLRANLDKVTRQQVNEVYAKYNISSPHLTCLYCGGLYPDKKLDFLLAACKKIQHSLPGFSLLVVGGGPEADKMQEASERFSWLHYLGPKFGAELAVYFRSAQALLLPGGVGLTMIDCFVAGVPLFTTDNKIHGPEIAYLAHGVNGSITPYNEQEYAQAVIAYLRSPGRTLVKGCLQSAHTYTLDNMVANFVTGIRSCLK